MKIKHNDETCAEAAKEINRDLNSQYMLMFCLHERDTPKQLQHRKLSETQSYREATKQANCTKNKAVNAAT